MLASCISSVISTESYAMKSLEQLSTGHLSVYVTKCTYRHTCACTLHYTILYYL